MSQGYVKIHRQLLESSFHNKPNYFCLWITLLLMANHKETKFLWNGKEEILQPGQILTGRKSLSEQTGIPETTIEGLIGVMVKMGQVRQQKTTKHRVITVLKWDSFQILDNKPTTNRQQTDTYKNDKNDKNVYNTITSEPSSQVIEPIEDGVSQVMKSFYDLGNTGLNFGNKTERSAAKWLVEKYGLEKSLNTINYAFSIQGKKFAPVITTP